MRDGLVDRAAELDGPLRQEQSGGAKLLDRRHAVANENNRPPLTGDVLHFAQALLLKFGVADREHLIDDQHLGLEMRRDRKG